MDCDLVEIGQVTVRELIEQLQRCDQEAEVYNTFHLGDHAAVGRTVIVQASDRVLLLFKPERQR